MSDKHAKVLIIGAGTAGITVAARLRRKGVDGITIVDPAGTHHYQPLWTLVGGGRAPAEEAHRPMKGLIPAGVTWLQESVDDISPDTSTVTTEQGTTLTYDWLVVCPGIQLDWDKVAGMQQAVETPSVSSNYRFDLTGKTWQRIQDLRSGSAVFTMPAGPIKCAGAPQKIAYLACDYWRQQGVLDDIDVHLVLPTPGMFGVPVFAKELEKVVARYGIEVHFTSDTTRIDTDAKKITIKHMGSGEETELPYDFAHVVPPQSAPDWLKKTPLADPDNPAGYVQVDKNTLRHTRYENVFALGDAGSTPNSKTGAAIRKQAPVLVDNLVAAMEGAAVEASYGGYASCPLTTARDKMLLAEFDYTMEPKPSIPIIDTTRERKDMWFLKRYGLPALYWNLMLKGRA